MHGLKLKITLTLLLLLATAALLTYGIITLFWHLSLLKSFTDNKIADLSAFAETSSADVNLSAQYLQRLNDRSAGLCGAILVNGTWRTTADPACGSAPGLRKAVEQAAAAGEAVTARSGSGFSTFLFQKEFLHIAVPLPRERSPRGAIGISYPLPSLLQTLWQHQKIILIYILFNTVILTVIGFFRIASIAIRPLDRLIEITSNYPGELDTALASESEGSEFRQLSLAINRMVHKIGRDKIHLQETVRSLKQANETIQKTQQEMVRTEKLASVGRLSAGLAHEIGNPLGIVLGYLGLLRQDTITREDKHEYLDRAEQELNRINNLVRQLLDFSRPQPATRKPVPVHDLLLSLQQMLQTQKKNKEISFRNHLLAEHDVVFGSEESLRQAFLNFFLNALDAIHEKAAPDQGIIMTESGIIEDESGNSMLQVKITDSGTGISPVHLKSIFDPFFTTKEPGKGTGLGLTVAHTVIENTGGRVRAESSEGQGTTVIVELPTISEGTADRQ